MYNVETQQGIIGRQTQTSKSTLRHRGSLDARHKHKGQSRMYNLETQQGIIGRQTLNILDARANQECTI